MLLDILFILIISICWVGIVVVSVFMDSVITEKKIVKFTFLKGIYEIFVFLGTRGGDMFEAHLPVSGRKNDSYSLLRVGWSHCKGRYWGLAAHPLRDEVSANALQAL